MLKQAYGVYVAQIWREDAVYRSKAAECLDVKRSGGLGELDLVHDAGRQCVVRSHSAHRHYAERRIGAGPVYLNSYPGADGVLGEGVAQAFPGYFLVLLLRHHARFEEGVRQFVLLLVQLRDPGHDFVDAGRVGISGMGRKGVPEGPDFGIYTAVGKGVVRFLNFLHEGVLVHSAKFLDRSEGGYPHYVFMVDDHLPVPGAGIVQDVDVDAVGRAVAVGGEDGVAAVVGIHEKEIVSRGAEGEAHVLGLAPGLRLLVPVREVEVVSADAVEAVGGEIEGFPVRGQHGVNLVPEGCKAFTQKARGRPAAVCAVGEIEVSHLGPVLCRIDQAGCVFREIGGISGKGIQDIRAGVPALGLHGIVLEEVFPGKTVTCHHMRVCADFGHVNGVLDLLAAFFQKAGRGRIVGQIHCAHVFLYRLVEQIEAVKTVALVHQAFYGKVLPRQVKPRRNQHQNYAKQSFAHFVYKLTKIINSYDKLPSIRKKLK